MTVRLGDPVLIFIHNIALLLIGVAVGMHWHQSHSAAVWIAISGALLLVINARAESKSTRELSEEDPRQSREPRFVRSRVSES